MERTFDVKVIGYEAIQAVSAQDAINKFDERFLSKDYLVSDLRWKSISAYDVEGSGYENKEAELERLLAEARSQLSEVKDCLEKALYDHDKYELGTRVYNLWVETARKLV